MSPSSSTRRPRPGPLGYVASLLLPVAALAIGLVDLWTWEPGMRSSIVQRMDRTMDALGPELVLVGNSELNCAVDPELLGERLGLRVAKLSAGGTAMPYWYAVVRNRVYSRGFRPRFVLLMGDVPRLLEGRGDAADSSVLFEQLASEGPVDGPNVFGDRDASVSTARLRAQRSQVRAALIEPLRNGLVGLAWGSGPLDARIASGERWVREAGGAVFDPSLAIDLDLHARVMPAAKGAASSRRPQDAEVAKRASEAAAGLLLDLVDLTSTYEAQLIVVRAPLRSDNPADDVAPEVDAFLDGLLQERGVPHFRDVGAPDNDAAFVDLWHMRPEYQRAYTLALAQHLLEVGVGQPP